MPGYVKKALLQFQHIKEGGKKQHSPSPYTVPVYGKKCQMTDIDLTAAMTKNDKSQLQKTTGKFLYYGRAVDDTMLHALNCLATRINDGTARTKAALKHFLDYCHDNPDAVKLYVASDMILFIDSDALYLVEPMARSRAGGFFYLGNKDGSIINGSILILAKVIKFVMSSAAEAEIAALFLNAKLAIPLRQALIDMGFPQPKTKIKTDNSTAEGIVNDKIKQNRSKAIDMRFYWLKCRQSQEQFDIYWEKGATNLADYFTKHHSPAHHKAVRPIYLYDEQQRLSAEGCAKVLQDRATSGKRLRLTKSLVTENALAALRRNIVTMKSTRMPGRPCNLKEHVQKLLESIHSGRIRA